MYFSESDDAARDGRETNEGGENSCRRIVYDIKFDDLIRFQGVTVTMASQRFVLDRVPGALDEISGAGGPTPTTRTNQARKVSPHESSDRVQLYCRRCVSVCGTFGFRSLG